jgi:hypothetical protein
MFSPSPCGRGLGGGGRPVLVSIHESRHFAGLSPSQAVHVSVSQSDGKNLAVAPVRERLAFVPRRQDGETEGESWRASRFPRRCIVEAPLRPVDGAAL